jgi:hypothetical protein
MMVMMMTAVVMVMDDGDGGAPGTSRWIRPSLVLGWNATPMCR